MKIKVCSQCGCEYEDYGQRSSLCRDCRRAYNREYHKNRSESAKKKKIANQRKRQRNILQKVVDFLKEHPCVVCGETRIACLQFDHLNRDKKLDTVSELVRLGHSELKVFNEIEKCRVVCANCHMEHTANQMGWYKDINI